MARQFNRLSPAFIQSAPLGRHADGAGLYLQVHGGNGARHRSWLFRYRKRWMGLGPTRDVSLAQARRKAQECRQQLLAGFDPIEEKRRRACQRPATPTFDQCALAYWNSHCAGWRSVAHAGEWKRSLAAYASPVFGKGPVDLSITHNFRPHGSA
jgi:Arm DNA-binding domain